MNKNQIKLSLERYGYTYKDGELMDLSKITMIFMDHDVRLFPDSKTRFKFNSNTLTNSDDGEMEIYKIVNNKTEFMGQVPFKAIGGFIQTSKLLSNGQIIYR